MTWATVVACQRPPEEAVLTVIIVGARSLMVASGKSALKVQYPMLCHPLYPESKHQ